MRVLVADDHPVVRKGVKNVLREIAGITEIEEAATREETLEKIETSQPDIVIMNTTLVDAYCIEVLQQIKKLQPHTPVILLHPEPDAAFAASALASGASGIVTKLDEPEALVEAIETVALGGTYVSATIKSLMNGGNDS
jgi:two-component system invasion response regulator UvrY